MSPLEVDLSALFVASVIVIWFMIAYQFALTGFGFLNYLRSLKEKARLEASTVEYPACTVLIPARNEERVLGRTLEAVCALDYPREKLTVLVIDDGSTDGTGEIVRRAAVRDPRVQHYRVPPEEGGKGKSRALNVALRSVTTELVAVYDADNTPDPAALRHLAAQLLAYPALGAALGKFRTRNRNASLLTRFINIETLSFQSILQAGRWQMHNIATLPGTNFAIWTAVLHELDGWDEKALTEDSELTIRLYQRGYKVKFVPYAVTYEQEPQAWGVWVRQRMRWVRGNSYVLGKFLREIPRFKSKRLAVDILYTLSLYYLFFFAILISHGIFLASATGLITIPLPGPYLYVWIMGFVLFVAEILLAISYDGEDTPGNLGLIVLMYFTYCQFWLYVVLRAWYVEYIKKETPVWEKTARAEMHAEGT
jgi:cellulose synthase/poly-beta-1,6-N-acetylglucosamine synthase-like glycosyltransferase